MPRAGLIDNEPARPKVVRQRRYWMFRLKNESEGGAPAEAPDGVREIYESQPAFQFAGGWPQFGVKWDIDRHDPEKLEDIIQLDESLWAAWQKHCESVAKAIPKAVTEVLEVDRPEFEDEAEVTVYVGDPDKTVVHKR